jgi:serine protease Do
MTKLIAAALVVVALIGWFVLTPRPAAAQGRAAILSLYGPGSWIGVSVREATDDDAVQAKLAQPAGVVVESIQDGSPAARAGFRVGDLVLDYRGERVLSVRHFTRLVQESAPRRAVSVGVMRGTERQTLDVVPEFSGEFGNLLSRDFGRQLRERIQRDVPRNFNFNIDPDFLQRRGLAGGRNLGITLAPLGDQLAEYFGVKEGALVSSVQTGSAAADAGLRAGDVITAINGRMVRDASDVIAEIRRAQPAGALDISVMRDKKPLTLKATLPARPAASGRGGLPV